MMEDKVRNLAPAQIAPLLALSEVRWISLQKTDDPAKRAGTASQPRLTDWMDEITDFADTAALIENLDLVIAVDTSVAQLAAAMGRPVWLLDRFAGCWRWLRDRVDSPWYPTVRLFDQQQRGDWEEVPVRVAAALQQRFGGEAQGGSSFKASRPFQRSRPLGYRFRLIQRHPEPDHARILGVRHRKPTCPGQRDHRPVLAQRFADEPMRAARARIRDDLLH